MLKDRVEIYTQSAEDRRASLLKIGNQLSDALSLEYEAQFAFPLLETINALDLFLIFLDVIFDSVTFFLIILSLMLIYSLMVSV